MSQQQSSEQQFTTGQTRETETGRMLIQEGLTPHGQAEGGTDDLYFGTNQIDFISQHNNKQFSVTNQMDNGFNHGLIEIKENQRPYKASGWKESELAINPKIDRNSILNELKDENASLQPKRVINQPQKSSMKIHPIEVGN